MSHKIFVSSTISDLTAHREAVRDIILSLNLHPVMSEHFPSMDVDAVNACKTRIDECVALIGIYAHRYGYIPNGSSISITEIEFHHAVVKMPRLCFIVDRNFNWPSQHKEGDPGKTMLEAFKQAVDRSMIRNTFTTPDSLAAKVAAAIYPLQFQAAAVPFPAKATVPKSQATPHSLTASDRAKLIDLLAGIQIWRYGDRSTWESILTDSLLPARFIEHLAPTADPRAFAMQVVRGLEPPARLIDAPQNTGLGLLVSYLLNKAIITLDDQQFCARLLIDYNL